MEFNKNSIGLAINNYNRSEHKVMQKSKSMVFMVMITLFVISFLTNIIEVLLPEDGTDLHLTISQE
mgnify:CR=1 FL=1